MARLRTTNRRARPDSMLLPRVLLLRVLVEERVQALARDLRLDVALFLDARLTAQPARGAHVERLVEDVLLGFLGLAEQLLALGHVDMARRAGAHPAARVALPRVGLLGRFQDGCPDGDLHFPAPVQRTKSNGRHQLSPRVTLPV